MQTRNRDNAPKLSPVKGVEMKILGSGNNVTLCYIIVQPGAKIETHGHHNEQIGTCIEGSGELVCQEQKVKIVPGKCWTIPPNQLHSFIATGKESAILIEAFSPPREDYLKMAK
jgi:mannose-6-phosphate isomerase-like protein (cupin superfamily)